jgi:hypothetical protein
MPTPAITVREEALKKPPATSDKSQEMSDNYSETFGNDTKISGGMDDEGN